jgi:predicted transcriptional regulator
MPAKTATKSANTLENVSSIVREAGEDGITVKDVATKAGVTVDSVRKAVKELIEKGSVKRDKQKLFPVARQGRRSTEVVDRDASVLKAIKAGGKSGKALKAVAEELGVTERLTYESIWRLREAGEIHREGSTRSAVWVAG